MLNEIIISGKKLDLGNFNYMAANAFMSLILDMQGNAIYANNYFCRVTGFTAEDIVGRSVFEFIASEEGSLLSDYMETAIATGEHWRGEIRYQRNNGEMLWLDATLVPRHDTTGDIVALIMICFDITQQVIIRERLHYRAHNDALTKTLNRQGFYIRSRKKISIANARNEQVVIAILDLDNFKDINDYYGHAAGDEVLRSFSSRIKNCLAQGTLLGRLGGDEFALTFIKGIDELDVQQLFQQIVEQTQTPLRLQSTQQEISLSVSIGVASYPCHGVNFSSVLKAADSALYHVKSRGGDGFMHYQEPVLALPTTENKKVLSGGPYLNHLHHI